MVLGFLGIRKSLINLDHEIEKWEAPLSYYYKKEGEKINGKKTKRFTGRYFI